MDRQAEDLRLAAWWVTIVTHLTRRAEQPEADLYSEAVTARVRECCYVAVQTYIQTGDYDRGASTEQALSAGVTQWETTGTMGAFLPRQPEAHPKLVEQYRRNAWTTEALSNALTSNEWESAAIRHVLKEHEADGKDTDGEVRRVGEA